MEAVLLMLPNFLLVFCRITAFFVVAPLFSSRNVPASFKIGLSAFIAFIVFTSLGSQNPIPADGLYFLSIIREVLLGLTLGFITYLFFTAVQIAGSFIDIQIGFGIANVIDPLTGAQSPIVGQFKFIVGLLLFLSFNGHHYMLSALMDSYQWVPIENRLFEHIASGDLSTFVVKTFTVIFALAFQLAAPVVVALFLTDLALGVLARTAPQFNIFVVGIPVKMIVGLLLLVLIIPGFAGLFGNIFETMFEALSGLLHLLSSS
jgi:flagellar biosynthesis protein FliR